MLNTYLANTIPQLHINIVVVIMFGTITSVITCSIAIRERKRYFCDKLLSSRMAKLPVRITPILIILDQEVTVRGRLSSHSISNSQDQLRPIAGL